MPVHKTLPGATLPRRFFFLLRNSRRLGRMLWDIRSGRYAPSPFVFVALGLCLAYILFPFDLIPEFIPLLGWLDDGLVYYLTLQVLNKALADHAQHCKDTSGPAPSKRNS